MKMNKPSEHGAGEGRPATQSGKDRPSEGEFSALVENTPDVIARFDRNLRHLYVNRAVTTLTGHQPDFFLGKTNRELGMPAHLVSLWEETAKRAFATGEPQEVEFEFTGPASAHPRCFHSRLIPERDAHGSVATLLAIATDITERKNIENELRQQKKLLDAILDNLPVGLSIKDAKTLRYVRRNNFAEKLTGYSHDNYLGKTICEVRPGSEDLHRADLLALSTRAMVDMPNNRIITKSGEVRWQQARKVPIFGEDGEPLLVVTISDDITEHKRADDDLREQKQMLDAIIDNLPVGLAIKDAKTLRIVRRNRFNDMILGCKPGELIGKTVQEAFSPADAKTIHETDIEALRSRGVVEIAEQPLSTKAGQIRYRFVRKVPLLDEHGEPRLLLSISDDITDRKRVLDALRESEERFRLLAENISDVFWIAAPRLERVFYVSPAYDEIWGRSREEVYRDPLAWQGSIHPEDRVKAAGVAAERAPGQSFACEYRILHADGSVRWIWDRSYTVVVDGKVRMLCGIAEDISERKRIEAQRIAREMELRGTLVKEVHHRIKNHLQGVAGLLRRKLEVTPLLTPILESAVSEMQAIAAVFGVRLVTQDQRAELGGLLRPIIAAVQDLTSGHVQFDYCVGKDTRIFLDESEQVALALVLNELIFNSFKHAPHESEPKKTRVTVQRAGEGCRVVVVNKGSLGPDFDFAGRRGAGAGLALVHTLLPPESASLEFSEKNGCVYAMLTLMPPLVVVETAPALSTSGAA
jgi:PAS domain S-box-containing protein